MTVPLLVGIVLSLSMVLAGSPKWKKTGAALLLVFVLLLAALYLVLGMATRRSI